MAQGKDPSLGCDTGLIRDYSFSSIQRLRILYSQYIILHFVLRSALRSLHFEIQNVSLGVLLTSHSPAEANFHVF